MTDPESLLASGLRGVPLRRVSVTDAHAHVGLFARASCPFGAARHLVEAMDRTGVERACVNAIQYPDMLAANRLVLDALRQYPGRFVGFIAINPNYPEDLADELERGFAAGMAGIKIHERIHQYPVDGPNCRPVLEFADAHRLPVLVHVSSGPGAPSLRNVAGRYRNARFIIAHYNSGDEDGSIAAAARHDNVYLCTSFTQMAYGAIERLSGALGSRRLIFGSDMPLSDLGHRLGGILGARLNDADKENILGGNILRLIGDKT